MKIIYIYIWIFNSENGISLFPIINIIPENGTTLIKSHCVQHRSE